MLMPHVPCSCPPLRVVRTGTDRPSGCSQAGRQALRQPEGTARCSGRCSRRAMVGEVSRSLATTFWCGKCRKDLCLIMVQKRIFEMTPAKVEKVQCSAYGRDSFTFFN